MLEQLSLIALGQAAGFSLDEIRGLLAGGPRAAIDRQALEARVCEIDATVWRLQALAKGLHHAAVCPAPDHFACPTFQRLLRAAGGGKLAKSPPVKAVRRGAKVRGGDGPARQRQPALLSPARVNRWRGRPRDRTPRRC